VFATSGTYPWSFVTQIFHNGQPSHGGDRKITEVMIMSFICVDAGDIHGSNDLLKMFDSLKNCNFVGPPSSPSIKCLFFKKNQFKFPID